MSQTIDGVALKFFPDTILLSNIDCLERVPKQNKIGE